MTQIQVHLPSSAIELSIIVPVKNEQDSLTLLIDEIKRSMAQVSYAYEVIYIDDGSQDNTLVLLKQIKKTFPPLRILKHEKSLGQSTSIYHGVLAARGRWIATLDGDGQNDPADIPALVEALIESTKTGQRLNLIAGHRVTRQDSEIKKISSLIANRVRSKLLGDNTPDTGCGLKVFERDFFVRLPYFDHMHRFLPALFLRQGGYVISMPVNHRGRQAGASNYGTLDRLYHGIIDLLGVMWLKYRSRLTQASNVLVEEIGAE